MIQRDTTSFIRVHIENSRPSLYNEGAKDILVFNDDCDDNEVEQQVVVVLYKFINCVREAPLSTTCVLPILLFGWGPKNLQV